MYLVLEWNKISLKLRENNQDDVHKTDWRCCRVQTDWRWRRIIWKLKVVMNSSQMSVLDLELVQRQKLVVKLTHWGIGVNSVIQFFAGVLLRYYFTVLFRWISLNFKKRNHKIHQNFDLEVPGQHFFVKNSSVTLPLLSLSVELTLVTSLLLYWALSSAEAQDSIGKDTWASQSCKLNSVNWASGSQFNSSDQRAKRSTTLAFIQ